ncbi:MAG: WD40 repeat domain-containing protein [Gimesia sp.]|nr:WD40 repeat domain-containing protein [Gimesia sp.]
MEKFDPYHKWLGIPPRDQPPNHYRLLGIDLFEDDLDVIEAAADRCMAFVQQCALGEHMQESQQLLNELSAARVCLLVTEQKEKYDRELTATLKPVEPEPTATEAKNKPLPPSQNEPEHETKPAHSEFPATTIETPDQTPKLETLIEKFRFPKVVWAVAGGGCLLILTIILSLQFGIGGKEDSQSTVADTPSDQTESEQKSGEKGNRSLPVETSEFAAYFTVQSLATEKQPSQRLKDVVIELFYQPEQNESQQSSLGTTTTDDTGQANLLVKLTSAQRVGTFLAKLTNGNQSWERELTNFPVRLLQEFTIPVFSSPDYLNPDWIEQRLSYIGIDRLIEEYESEKDSNILKVNEALKLSRQILHEHPRALREQLQARLVGLKEPAFSVFQSLPNNRYQFRSEWPTFNQPGDMGSSSTGVTLCTVLTPNGTQALSGSHEETLKFWDLTSGRRLESLPAHPNGVYCVTVTPDNKQAITGSTDNILKVWDITNGKLIHSLNGHSGLVRSVTVTPDGTQAISGSADKTVKVWDLASGKLLKTLEGHYSSVSCVAVTPDGKQVISGSTDKTLMVWDLTSGELIQAFEEDSGRVFCVAVTPDGKQIISGSDNNTLQIWDLASGKRQRTLKGHSSVVNCVAVTADGKQILSGSEDKTLRLWNIQDGSLIATCQLDNIVHDISLSPDNKTVVVGSEKSRIHKLTILKPGDTTNSFPDSSPSPSDFTHEINLTVREEQLNQQPGGALTGVAIDLYHQAGQNGTPLTFLSTAKTDTSGRALLQVKLSARQLSGTFLAKLSKDNETWDRQLVNCPRILSFNLSIPIAGPPAYLNPEWIEQRLAQVGIVKLLQEYQKNTDANALTVKAALEQCRAVLLKNPKAVREQLQAQLVNRLEPALAAFQSLPQDRIQFYSNWPTFNQQIATYKSSHNCVVITPDGKQCLTISYNTLRVWDVDTGKQIRWLTGHSSYDNCMVFTPDGKHVISKGKKNSLQIWELSRSRLRQSYRGHTKSIQLVTVTPDGTRAISGSSGAPLKLWYLHNGKMIRTIGSSNHNTLCMAVTPNGKQVVSCTSDNSLNIWNLDTGKLIRKMKADLKNSTCITITPDSTFAISGAKDKTIKVWEIGTGTLRATYELNDIPQSLAIGPDGQTLIVCSESGRFYKLSISMPGKPILALQQNRTSIVKQNSTSPIKKTLAWNEVPIPPTWPDLSKQHQATIQSAHGLIGKRFLWCLDLPLQAFLDMQTELRVSQYRPQRVRPFVKNGSVFVSLVCFRDAQPWQILSGVSSQEILSKSKELKAEGWSPTEVAGYHDKSDKYIGVWKKGAPSLVYIDVGLSKTQHDANFQKLMNLNLYMHQQHVFFDANNQYRFSNIWYRKPSSTTKWGSWYGGVDNHKSKQGIHPFQSDTTVATQGSSLVYSGSWVDHPLYISLELIDLDLVEHQSKANQLMNLGYRPFAVDACFAKNEIQSSSVWYRPK